MSFEVINGEAVEEMARLIARGVTVDVVVTDPPYNAINRETGGLRIIDKGVADSAPVDIEAVADLLIRIVKGSLYVWCSGEQFSRWTLAFRNAGLTTRNCAWLKTNPSPMNGEHLWLSALELCVFARKRGAVFNEFCAAPEWKGPIEAEPLHPCPKPVWLMRELIRASTRPGDTVLDPFAGSFTTGVACAIEGRKFIGIEQDASYCAIGEARITRARGIPADQPKLNRKQIETPLFGDSQPVL